MPRILVALLVTLPLTACVGAYRVTPVSPTAADSPTPLTADPDAGLVAVDPTLDLRQYRTILVQPFTVNAADVKDEDDRKLAAIMPGLLQSELVIRMRAAGTFERVVNLAETTTPTDGGTMLRLEGTLSRLSTGSRALRYFVGFGAGASKAQIETRFVDVATGKVVLATADRREAAFGIFGGDGEEHLREALSDTARDLAKLVARLKATAPSGVTTTALTPTVIEPRAVAAVPLAGTWRSGDGRSTLTISESGTRLRWALETTDVMMISQPYFGGSRYRAEGEGSASGDDLALSGRVTAGDGQAMNRPFTLTLTRDGNRLRGSAVGTRNVPYAVDLERQR
jgi:hypothetical protein